MKILLLALSILFALTSCTKSDNAVQTPPQSILPGKYKLTEYNVQVAVDLNNDGVFNKNLLKETSCFNNDILELFNTLQFQSITKVTTNWIFPLTIVNCNNGFSTVNSTWSENETNIFIERTGGRIIWLKEGNGLRYIYPNPSGQGFESFLWTKQ